MKLIMTCQGYEWDLAYQIGTAGRLCPWHSVWHRNPTVRRLMVNKLYQGYDDCAATQQQRCAQGINPGINNERVM